MEWEEVETIEVGGGGGGQGLPLSEFEVIGTSLGDVLQDEDGSVGPRSLLPVVDDLMSDLPYTTREIGKGKLSSRLYEAVQEAGGVMTNTTPPAPAQPSAPAADTEVGDLVDNTQQRTELKRKQLVRLVKRHVTSEITQDKDRMGQAMQWTWRDLYKKGSVPWPQGVESGQLLKTLDEPTLDKLILIIERG